MTINKTNQINRTLIELDSPRETLSFVNHLTNYRFEAGNFKPFLYTDQAVKEATNTWDLSFLESKLSSVIADIYVSADGTFPGGKGPYDETKYKDVSMPVPEFLQRVSGTFNEPILKEGEKYYLYQKPESLFAELLKDLDVDKYLPTIAKSKNFWLSGQGNITPIHYDLADNFLVQLMGRKKVLLWNPTYYSRLNLNPIGTKHDRQSKINPNKLDENSARILSETPVFVHDLVPGQILFIPTGWPHFVLTETLSCSMNLWWGPQEMEFLQVPEDSPEVYMERVQNVLLHNRPELAGMIEGMIADGSIQAIVN